LKTHALTLAAISLAALVSGAQAQQAEPMTFFITSEGSGKGADFGGLAGADALCQRLATAAGRAGTFPWRAYLSTTSANGGQVVNARDRIGAGPWHNAKGELIARSLDELHSPKVNITKQTALTEKGTVVNGRGDTPNVHDILTGSRPDGTAGMGTGNNVPDSTCRNWTHGGDDGSAIVGHHDRQGLNQDPPMLSWNASHPTGGCSVPKLAASGGGGLIYCFAAR
jgi:hypothetical protein